MLASSAGVGCRGDKNTLPASIIYGSFSLYDLINSCYDFILPSDFEIINLLLSYCSFNAFLSSAFIPRFVLIQIVSPATSFFLFRIYSFSYLHKKCYARRYYTIFFFILLSTFFFDEIFSFTYNRFLFCFCVHLDGEFFRFPFIERKEQAKNAEGILSVTVCRANVVTWRGWNMTALGDLQLMTLKLSREQEFLPLNSASEIDIEWWLLRGITRLSWSTNLSLSVSWLWRNRQASRWATLLKTRLSAQIFLLSLEPSQSLKIHSTRCMSRALLIKNFSKNSEAVGPHLKSCFTRRQLSQPKWQRFHFHSGRKSRECRKKVKTTKKKFFFRENQSDRLCSQFSRD